MFCLDRGAIRRFADSANQEERRKTERLLRTARTLKPGAVFSTGTGRPIRVISVGHRYIYFKMLHTHKIIRVPKQNLQKMFQYFLLVRIVERKELEVFNNFSSVLFGLLSTVFRHNSKICLAGRLLRLIKTGVRVFLAGGERSPCDVRMAAQAGAKYVLYSYYYIRKRTAWKKHLIENNLRCILDCGAFTERKARQKERETELLDIDEYIEFIKKHSDVIDHYFVFDAIGDYRQTRENLRYMESKGLTPIPIYHMRTPVSELDRLVEEGYPVIGLGCAVGRKGVEDFLEAVFPVPKLCISRSGYWNDGVYYEISILQLRQQCMAVLQA